MSKRSGVVVAVAVIAAVVVGWFVYSHRGGTVSGDRGGGGGSDVADGSGGSTGSGGSARDGAIAPGARPDSPAQLVVTVRDDRGALAGALVRAAPQDDDGDADIATAKTAADGTATLALSPGAWSISASAAGHLPAAIDRTLRGGEHGSAAIALVAGGAQLAGTVSDALGGPIAGARVDAAKLGAMAAPDSAIASAITGTDGKYAMTVPIGHLLVAARDASYAPQSRYLEVGAAGATADFALVPGGVIEGTVVDDRTKSPVPGATVAAARDRGGASMFESGRRAVKSGADGKFRIGGLPPGVFDLDARLGLQVSRSATRIGLGVAEQVGGIELLIGNAPVVRGKVVGESGLAAAGVSINAFGAHGDGGGGGHGTSATDGKFEIAGLPPGTYFLMGGGGAFLADGTTAVEVADVDVAGVIVKVRNAATVTGRIDPPQVCEVRYDLDSKSLRDGSMPMLVRPTTSKPDGTFALTPVSPGTGTVGARCASGDEGTAPVVVSATGGDPVIVKVTPGASIAGKIVDGTGKPVAGVGVMANASASSEHVVVVNGMITSGAQTTSNLDGTYEVRGLTAGTYRLAVLSRGKPLASKGGATKLDLATGEHKTGVDLAVDVPDGTIQGTVTGADGKPIADAWVSVHQDLTAMIDDMRNGGAKPDGGGDGDSQMMTIEAQTDDSGGDANEIAPVLTDASGKFAIHGLPRQHFDVIAEAQQGKLRGRATAVQPDATIAITATGVTQLTGTVHAGTPISVFEVELDGPTKTSRGFAAGNQPSGTFAIDRVDPGSYTVHVTSSAGTGDAKVTIASGQAATVDVALVANAVVIGKLVDAGGKPVPNIGVAIVPDTSDGRVQLSLSGPPPTSGSDGTFRVEAPAGKSVLIVMTPPKPVTKRGLALEAGKTLDAGTITLP